MVLVAAEPLQVFRGYHSGLTRRGGHDNHIIDMNRTPNPISHPNGIPMRALIGRDGGELCPDLRHEKEAFDRSFEKGLRDARLKLILQGEA